MGIEARILERADRQALLMGRMMDRLGVTTAAASLVMLGAPMRWACRSCMACRHADECEAWLSSSNAAFVADAPDFCPNANFFRRLRRSSVEGR